MGSVAEALLQLPEVPFSRADAAEAAGVPAGLWLTVGLLAADGFALQLRLRKADKVRQGLVQLLWCHMAMAMFAPMPAGECLGVPAGLRLTVGLLAGNGFALQLRLRKADKVCGGLVGCHQLLACFRPMPAGIPCQRGRALCGC